MKKEDEIKKLKFEISEMEKEISYFQKKEVSNTREFLTLRRHLQESFLRYETEKSENSARVNKLNEENWTSMIDYKLLLSFLEKDLELKSKASFICFSVKGFWRHRKPGSISYLEAEFCFDTMKAVFKEVTKTRCGCMIDKKKIIFETTLPLFAPNRLQEEKIESVILHWATSGRCKSFQERELQKYLDAKKLRDEILLRSEGKPPVEKIKSTYDLGGKVANSLHSSLEVGAPSSEESVFSSD